MDTTAPGPDTPARLSFVVGADSSTRLAQLGLAGLLATSLLVCLSATQSELLLPSSLRPLPDSLAVPLAGAGLKLGVFALIAAFGLMFASYAAATRAAEKLSPRGAALGGVAVAALAFAFFGTAPLQLPSILEGVQSEGGPHSIVGFLLAAVGVEPVPRALTVALTLVFLAIVAWLLRKIWLGEMDWIAGAGWATAALLVSTGFLVPWYVAWLLPLAALSSDKRLLAAAVILTGVGLTTL